MTSDRPTADLLTRRARDRATPPERLMLVLLHMNGRYALVRRADWPQPALLSTLPPHPDEGFAAGLARLVRSRTGLRASGEPVLAHLRAPVRMWHPYAGGETLGWLRAVALLVEGDPEPDGTLAGVELLTREDAERALSTDLERMLFRAGAEAMPERGVHG